MSSASNDKLLTGVQHLKRRTPYLFSQSRMRRRRASLPQHSPLAPMAGPIHRSASEGQYIDQETRGNGQCKPLCPPARVDHVSDASGSKYRSLMNLTNDGRPSTSHGGKENHRNFFRGKRSSSISLPIAPNAPLSSSFEPKSQLPAQDSHFVRLLNNLEESREKELHQERIDREFERKDYERRLLHKDVELDRKQAELERKNTELKRKAAELERERIELNALRTRLGRDDD